MQGEIVYYKGIQGSHLSIPYDLPAPVKVTYRLWCLRSAMLCNLDLSNLSSYSKWLMITIFQCVSAVAPVSSSRSIGITVPVDVEIWTCLWPNLFFHVDKEWSVSSVKYVTSTINLIQWYGYEAFRRLRRIGNYPVDLKQNEQLSKTPQELMHSNSYRHNKRHTILWQAGLWKFLILIRTLQWSREKSPCEIEG